MMSGHLRRLTALVLYLPPEAMVWRVEQLAPAQEFQAQQMEQLDLWFRLMLAYHSGQNIQLPPPIQILRPGEEPVARKKKATIEEVAAFMSKLGG